MMVRAYSCAEESWALAAMVLARSGPSKLPLASLTLAEAMAERTSARVRPAPARALGLTCTRTAGRCPYTPNWHGVAALCAGTQAIFKEGMDAAFARHEAVAAQCRAGLAELGIKLWTAPDAVTAPTVTAAMIPAGFTWPEWKEALRRRGLICTGSFGPMDGKVFRLGHMGTQAQPYLMGQALDAIAATLKK